MTSITIRRIRRDEWPNLRRLRLEALRDSPLAFGSTWEREAAFDEAEWRRWAASAARGDNEVLIVAAENGRWVAMARGSVSPEDAATAYLTAVYVTPAARGRGLARAVSAELMAWAEMRGCSRVLLHVADWNGAARRTYEALGFLATGVTEPLPHDSSVTEHEMVLVLDRGSGRRPRGSRSGDSEQARQLGE